jgi:outer membrane protein TolC
MHTTTQSRIWLLAAMAIAASVRAATAQGALTLDEAIRKALEANPAVRSALASQREADARRDQARAAFLPRVDFTEAWQRGDQPVFVFGSLLAQRRFTEENFAIDALNHPDPLTNYRMAFSVEQVVFDGMRSWSARDAAEFGQRLAALGARETAATLKTAATQAYGNVLMADAERRAARAAAESAEEDVKRVERRRDAGMATDADVLALQVYLARVREREIAAATRDTVARAKLNEVMGEPLDRAFTLAPPVPAAEDLPSIDELETDARTNRPDLLMASVREQMAQSSVTGAKAGYYPQASVMGGYEWNGNTFSDRAPSWNVGAYFRWNLFAGLGDAARVREARAAADRAAFEREALDTSVRVDLRAARARVEEARAREQVGRSARAQAEEGQRITRNRYEAGLAGINDILRAANAVLDAESLYTSALVDLVISAAQLDRARGR